MYTNTFDTTRDLMRKYSDIITEAENAENPTTEIANLLMQYANGQIQEGIGSGLVKSVMAIGMAGVLGLMGVGVHNASEESDAAKWIQSTVSQAPHQTAALKQIEQKIQNLEAKKMQYTSAESQKDANVVKQAKIQDLEQVIAKAEAEKNSGKMSEKQFEFVQDRISPALQNLKMF